MLSFKKNGFSLIELLIALALNAVLFVALISIFVSNVNHYRQFLNANRLNQQLQSILILMANDIRRAGYWANAKNDIAGNQNNNSFVSATTDIQIIGGNCILFAYDQNKDGSLPSISSTIDDERYGFRLNGQSIQSRIAGAPFDCAAGANEWENISDSNVIHITQLSFSLGSKSIVTGPGTKAILVRTITISITGQLVSDATISKTVSQTIRIRNDKFIP